MKNTGPSTPESVGNTSPANLLDHQKRFGWVLQFQETQGEVVRIQIAHPRNQEGATVTAAELLEEEKPGKAKVHYEDALRLRKEAVVVRADTPSEELLRLATALEEIACRYIEELPKAETSNQPKYQKIAETHLWESASLYKRLGDEAGQTRIQRHLKQVKAVLPPERARHRTRLK